MHVLELDFPPNLSKLARTAFMSGKLLVSLVLLLMAQAVELAGQSKQFPWKPSYRRFACPAAVRIKVPGELGRTPDVLLGVESDAALANHVEVAVASVLPPGEAQESGFRDVSNEVREEWSCVISTSARPTGNRRAAIHVRVRDGIPVILSIDGKSWFVPPGTVSFGGKAVQGDGRLFVLSIMALAYQPDNYVPRELQQKGDMHWITPSGLQRHLIETPEFPFAHRLESVQFADDAKVATYTIRVSPRGAIEAVEAVNATARDARLLRQVASLRLTAFQTKGTTEPFSGRLSILVLKSGKKYLLV